MTVIRGCFWLLAMFAATRFFGSESLAQQAGTATSFERGVQEFLGGNYSQAEPLLVRAIREDPHDPRPYYFRALCLLRQGHRVEARADMLIGATLEARARNNYSIDESLARVPVVERLALNEFRWRTGVVTAVTQPENAAVEINRPIATDAAVLRQRISVRLDQLVRPVSLTEIAETSAPPATTTATPPGESAVQPATGAEEVPAGNPFADDQPPESAHTIPSGKLMGILGRALFKSAPVQSFEGLREKLPELPIPGAGGSSPAAASAGSDATAAPAGAVAAPADENPFSEPSSPPAEKQNNKSGTGATDEDPFG